MQALKTIGSVLLVLGGLVGVTIVTYLFFTVGVKFAFEIAPIINNIASTLLFVNLVVLVFALVPQFRYAVGFILFISSFIFGISTWIYGLAVTLSFWGIIGVIAGFLLGGIGVVPIGMLAAALNGEWGIFFTLLWTAAITIVARIVGGLLVANAEERAAQPHYADLKPSEAHAKPRLRKWEDVD